TNTSAAWLFAVLVVSLFMAYRANASLRKNHESLRVLYGFTRIVAEPRQAEAIIPAALEQLKRMFKAEIAQLILFPSTEEGPSLRTVSGADGSVRQGEPLESSFVIGLWEDFARGRDAILLTGEDDLNRARMLFPELATDACMMTTLAGVQGVAGILMIGNPVAEVTSFGAGDFELLLTAASHVGVSLENGRLVEDLKHNEHRALHDSLTGLPNRSLLHDRLRQAILSGERQGSAVAVMLLDLDNFKEVNDTLGHHNGDIMLQEVGVRLRAVLRGSDTVARLGGDEFAILLPNVVDRGEIGRVAVKVLEAIQVPIILEELSLEVGASIGVAIYPDQGLDAATLIQRADIAMYSAKSHRTGYEVYTQERHRDSPGRLTLVSDLRAALDNGELRVHYQPKAELPSGKIIGAEALLRWDHPQHGLIPPDEFIPVAEHTGLMRAMTLFVLESAISQCRDWTVAGTPLTVAVNLSARSLLDARLPHDILILLRRWGVDASRLRLEITESSIMADPVRLVDVLAKLNDAGIGLSIDDFGTGYSSLVQLKRLPVDEIKIDKSFVLGMSHNENDAVIVQSTIDLGRNLGLRVVAEGVEDQATMDMLTDLGCDIAQGFFLSRPIPGDRFDEWIRELDEFSRNLESEVDAVTRPEEIVKVASAIPLRIA
ncbi:MAG: EAL domain-containing protein, partial [Actinomycetota bacterium]